MTQNDKPVLVLGGGINGAAIARELLLRSVPVWLVDSADVTSGTTAYSSRLIHGGLRYLEYGEFDLVRESLAERERLLKLSPQFVKPLRLFIPLENRLGGFWRSVFRFLGIGGKNKPQKQKSRGVWLVRWGLWFYDTYTGAGKEKRRGKHRVGDPDAIPVDPQTYRWLCSYTDAQIEYPERFVVSLLEDARLLARQRLLEFRVLTYTRATLKGQEVELRNGDDAEQTAPHTIFQPAAIVNATGAWVDRTLQSLKVDSKRLIGGTKGSHLLTWHEGLRDRLAGRGVYAEADDGRPVFLLPWGESTLVGTTDLPFDESPETAVADSDELEYLCRVVARIFPDVRLARNDIELHYCGVRPLPYVDRSMPASITRRHFFVENENCPLPMISVVGGKLTTCRSLAEEAAADVLAKLDLLSEEHSEERPLPGGESYPTDEEELLDVQQRLAEQSGFSLSQVQTVWSLCGTQTEAMLIDSDDEGRQNLDGTELPVAYARHVIRNEWVKRLEDLVERRLMLLYHRGLSEKCLGQLAELMVQADVLPASETEAEIERCRQRLHSHFGKRVTTG